LAAGLFCLLMAPEVYASLRLLAAHYHDRAAAKAALKEIAEQIGALPPLPEAIARVPAAPVRTHRRGRPVALDLRGVSLATPDGVPVLDDVDLVVPPGGLAAIVGPSGIGKSTLLETVARLRPHTGEILIDGAALEAIEEAALRARIALIGQRPRILAGSIADNIRLGRLDADDVAVRLAAQRACVTDFADDLPLGLATAVGENGLGLSGGELQRIALARLYLREPGLVLLDEPTAHLDAETEQRVLDGLLDFAEGRTLVVATHSLAVAARMRRVHRIAGRRLLPAPRQAGPAVSFERGAA
jgi:ATP-binding cassette subfamily C protein CydD